MRSGARVACAYEGVSRYETAEADVLRALGCATSLESPRLPSAGRPEKSKVRGPADGGVAVFCAAGEVLGAVAGVCALAIVCTGRSRRRGCVHVRRDRWRRLESSHAT
jgi:hypothetical protein